MSVARSRGCPSEIDARQRLQRRPGRDRARDDQQGIEQCFRKQPPFTWVQPDDQLRAGAQPAIFGGALRYIYPVERGTEVLLDNGAILGGAIWAPPGLEGAALAAASCDSGADPGTGHQAPSAIVPSGARAVQDALHRAHPPDPHWYLAMLGTDPLGQGKGVGSALVRSGLERCDREGEHAYLECFEPLVPYYERFGFEVTGEIEMPEEVPILVSMWRARR